MVGEHDRLTSRQPGHPPAQPSLETLSAPHYRTLPGYVSPARLDAGIQSCGSGSLLLFKDGADPWISSYKGRFYYTHTTGDSLCLWHGENIHELVQSRPVTLMDKETAGDNPFHNVWAPELHLLHGRWFMYFAADRGTNETHRMYALESLTDNPLGAWKYRGCLPVPGDDWAIDATVFETESGRMYMVWSGWTRGRGEEQRLFIAEMDTPLTFSSSAVCICGPDRPWEGTINEAPQILKRGGRVHLLYSGNGWWTKQYSLGMLTLEGDPLDPQAWRKASTPVFSGDPQVPHTLSVGHSSFLSSEDHDRGLVVYHALGPRRRRQVRVQPFEWRDGRPEFGKPLPALVREPA